MNIRLPEGWHVVPGRKPYDNYYESDNGLCAVGKEGGLRVCSTATTAQFLEAVQIAKAVRGIVDEPTPKERKIVAMTINAMGDHSIAFDDGTAFEGHRDEDQSDWDWKPINLPPRKEAT